MKGLRTILSIFFLTVFGIMSLHNVVPHVHHSHEDEHLATHHHSHADHEHHHHYGESEEKGLDDFLILLFANHTHTVEALEFDVELKQIQTLKKITQLDLNKATDIIDGVSFEDGYRYHLFKPRICHNNYCLSNSLRAPPALG